jgi:hypothetical protein
MSSTVLSTRRGGVWLGLVKVRLWLLASSLNDINYRSRRWRLLDRGGRLNQTRRPEHPNQPNSRQEERRKRRKSIFQHSPALHLILSQEHGNQLGFGAWSLSADASHILLKTDHLKQYRHSSFGNYYLHRLSDGSTFPLVPPSNPPRVAHAAWSPTGRSIAWVMANDIYVVQTPT